ncbi:hypothetical protein Tco_1156097, partial [Tanacetum coccineum]
KRQHTEQPETINDTYVVEKDDNNITLDSLFKNNEEERALLASLFKNMKIEIDERKKINKELKKANTSLYSKLMRYKESNYVKEDDTKIARSYGLAKEQKGKLEKYCSEAAFQVFDIKQKFSELEEQLLAHKNTISTLQYEKDEQKKFYKTREDKEMERVICLENEVKYLNDIVYKTAVDNTSLDVVEFKQTLQEEMVQDLRYFNSLEKEVESLQSQLKLQKTQF